jgi:enterochelin esterase family protein
MFNVRTLVLPAIVSLCSVAAAGRQRSASSVTDPHRDFPAGPLEAALLYDSSYQRPRRIWVYTPPAYDARRPAAYPLIVAFDGDEYRDTMPLPMILDTLLAAGRAPAFVAVLVDDSSGAARIADLCNSARMAEFLGKQLLPWVRQRWHVTRDPRRVIVTGSSAGGLAAAFVAFMRPDLFGNVWSQSGAFWRGPEGSNGAPWEWLTEQVKASARKDIRFYMDVGELEDHPTLGGSGPNFRDANRRFRDALETRGYEVTYTEVPGGNHAERWWRQRLPYGIVALSAGWPHS